MSVYSVSFSVTLSIGLCNKCVFYLFQCITFYWSVSALCSLVQLLLLKNQTVQGVLNIPDMEDLVKRKVQGASQAKDTNNNSDKS